MRGGGGEAAMIASIGNKRVSREGAEVWRTFSSWLNSVTPIPHEREDADIETELRI